VTGLSFRAAVSSDSDRIADIILGSPEDVATRTEMRLYGIENLDKMRRLFHDVMRNTERWRACVLAEREGHAAGVLETGGTTSFGLTLGTVVRALRLLGPVPLARLPFRLRVGARVEPVPPPGAYEVAALFVDPGAQSTGVGTALLEYAEADARERRHDLMALAVLTENPAVRLYERFGFHIAQTATDPTFERITGVRGRYGMVKTL
jgi:ribosomal protein S18 acetylase RimI-like enzyme